MDVLEKKQEIMKTLQAHHEQTMKELEAAEDEVIERIYNHPHKFGLYSGDTDTEGQQHGDGMNPEALSVETVLLFDAMNQVRNIEKSMLGTCGNLSQEEFSAAVDGVYKTIERAIGRSMRALMETKDAQENDEAEATAEG